MGRVGDGSRWDHRLASSSSSGLDSQDQLQDSSSKEPGLQKQVVQRKISLLASRPASLLGRERSL